MESWIGLRNISLIVPLILRSIKTQKTLPPSVLPAYDGTDSSE